MRQHHSFNLLADDSLQRQTKSISIKRQRSFQIVHSDGHHGDSWFHLFTTAPPMRIKDKKVEINTYAQQEASSLAGC